jgi:hypothetical protein
MSAFGDYLENASLDHNLNVTPLAQTPVYLHMYTSPVGDDDSGTEVVGNGYVATVINFGAASGGIALNNQEVVFPEATGSWGTVSHFAIKDVSQNLMYHGAWTTPKAVGNTDTARVAIGAVSVEHQ